MMRFQTLGFVLLFSLVHLVLAGKVKPDPSPYAAFPDEEEEVDVAVAVAMGVGDCERERREDRRGGKRSMARGGSKRHCATNPGLKLLATFLVQPRR